MKNELWLYLLVMHFHFSIARQREIFYHQLYCICQPGQSPFLAGLGNFYCDPLPSQRDQPLVFELTPEQQCSEKNVGPTGNNFSNPQRALNFITKTNLTRGSHRIRFLTSWYASSSRPSFSYAWLRRNNAFTSTGLKARPKRDSSYCNDTFRHKPTFWSISDSLFKKTLKFKISGFFFIGHWLSVLIANQFEIGCCSILVKSKTNVFWRGRQAQSRCVALSRFIVLSFAE